MKFGINKYGKTVFKSEFRFKILHSSLSLLLWQVPGVGACVGRRAVWLPGEEGPANSQRGQEVLQADHIRFGFLPQPFHLVGCSLRRASPLKLKCLLCAWWCFRKLMSSVETWKKNKMLYFLISQPLCISTCKSWLLVAGVNRRHIKTIFNVIVSFNGICCH